MPIYEYKCGKCGRKLEIVQGFKEGLPLCCGKGMNRIPASPSLIRITGKGGTRTYSRGYKDSYAKEYQKSIDYEPKT